MRRQSENWDTEPTGPTAGQQIARFGALVSVAFAVTAAIVVTRRLSQDSLALLIGLSCGVGAMLPTVLLGFMVWRRQDAQRYEEAQRQPAQHQFGYPGTPPVIVVTPQAMPTDYRAALGPPSPAGSWMPQQNHRTFTIVGDEE